MLIRSLLAVLLGYLLGSIPFSALIARWRTGLKIRQVGDGNAGARNVWHTVGAKWGVLVAVLDMAKGFAAIMLARTLGATTLGALLTGPATILGHAFSPFLRFRGGKGLAATGGILLAWAPWSTVAGLGILWLTQLFTRNFDRTIYFGAAAGIVLPPAFGYPWLFSLYFLGIFLMLAVIKFIDLPHERKVWAASGWRDVEASVWYDEPPGSEEDPGVALPGIEKNHH